MTTTKELLFASLNPHKVQEMRKLLPPGYSLTGLADIGWTLDIPEPFDSFEENAKAKVSYVFKHTGITCFADDSGLSVDALGGKPGVLSARYAGEHKSNFENINKVLAELGDTSDRAAKFIAVIACQINKDDVFLFRGEVAGHISFSPMGTGGFGYDPIFIPSGFDQTFGQLPPLVKNLISHRAKAMNKFLEFIHLLPQNPR